MKSERNLKGTAAGRRCHFAPVMMAALVLTSAAAATVGVVPRADNEGAIGTAAKRWQQANVVTGAVNTLKLGITNAAALVTGADGTVAAGVPVLTIAQSIVLSNQLTQFAATNHVPATNIDGTINDGLLSTNVPLMSAPAIFWPPTSSWNFQGSVQVDGNFNVTGTGTTVGQKLRIGDGSIVTADTNVFQVKSFLMVNTNGDVVMSGNLILLGALQANGASGAEIYWFSNSAKVFSLSPTNLNFGNFPVTNFAFYASNLLNKAVHSVVVNGGLTINATNAVQLFVTNASYTIAGFSDLVTGAQHVFSQTISNAAATAITVTGPPTTRYFGGSSTNALSIPAGKEATWSFWIWPLLRSNCVNIVEQ